MCAFSFYGRGQGGRAKRGWKSKKLLDASYPKMTSRLFLCKYSMGSKASFKMIFKENPGCFLLPSPCSLYRYLTQSHYFFFFSPNHCSSSSPKSIEQCGNGTWGIMSGWDTPWLPHKVFPLSGDCSHAAQVAKLKPHLLCWPCVSSGHCLHVLWAGTLCSSCTELGRKHFPYFPCPLWTFPLWNMCCIVGLVIYLFFFSRNWLEIDIFRLTRSFKIHPQELCGFLAGMGTLIKKKKPTVQQMMKREEIWEQP